MPNTALVVVHGMGTHDANSVKKEVVDACKTAFNLYSSLKAQNPTEKFQIVPVAYDDIFEGFRKKVQQHAGSVADRISGVEGQLSVDVVKAITDIENIVGQDKLFNTHWLDVLLYRYTLLNEPVRLRVAHAISKTISTVGSSNVHVLGHSLGTSVVHDAIAKSYGPENIRIPDGTEMNLNRSSHRLGSVHMVANVSRALESFVKVESSLVRPGPLGCTSNFIEYRHRLDPITKFRPFNPTDNGGWIPHASFRSVYRLIEPTAVTAVNVHNLGHYLANPSVHLELFNFLFRFRPNKKEREAAEEAYFEKTVEGKARALQSAFGELEFGDSEPVRALLTSARALKDMVSGFGEAF